MTGEAGPRRAWRFPWSRTWSTITAALVLAVVAAGCGAQGDAAPDGVSAGASTATSAVGGRSLLVRKDAKDLTAQEKADFVGAVLALKTMPPPAGDGANPPVTTPSGAPITNWYDYFVATHADKLVCTSDEPDQGGYGHSGPDLLTWHRALLLDFEAALGVAAGKPIAIPYWDWTDPASTAAVFSPDLVGSSGSPTDGYAVIDGPFRKGEWVIDVKPPVATDPAGQMDYVVRAMGTSPAVPPSSADWNTALTIPTYDAPPYDDGAPVEQSFRNFANGAIGATGSGCVNGIWSAVGIDGARMHDQGHAYVAGTLPDGSKGTMHDLQTSPNDPAFWLHHANVDRLAENWWRLHDYQFLPATGGPRGDNAGDVLWPYTYTNGDMARSTESLGYRYDQPESETVPQQVVGSSSTTVAASHAGH